MRASARAVKRPLAAGTGASRMRGSNIRLASSEGTSASCISSGSIGMRAPR